MANPSPNSFISAYKNYRVYLTPATVETRETWTIETRITKIIVGRILQYDQVWRYLPVGTQRLGHLELLDIANAIKNVEKRTDNPQLF